MNNEIGEYNLREGNIADVKRIMVIENEAFHSSIVESEDVFLQRLEIFSAGFYVLENIKTSEVAGYICSEIWSGFIDAESSRFQLGHSIKEVHEPEGTMLYIASMGILKNLRGDGLGQKMFNCFVENMLEKFRNINSIILIVSENWKSARRIYCEAGFVEVSVIKNFFVFENEISSEESSEISNEDAIVMMKKTK